MALSAGRTALLIIDMQNSFLHSDGSCARAGLDHERLRSVLPAVMQLVEGAREARLPIIFTRYVYRADYRDGGIVTQVLLPTLRENAALIAGSWDAELVEELNPREGEIVIDKNRPGAFYGTSLQSCLDGLDVDSLIVCGVTTNICVETTVREAMQRDYRVWVVAGATAEYEDDRYEVALKGMAWMFASVVDLDTAQRAIPQLAVAQGCKGGA